MSYGRAKQAQKSQKIHYESSQTEQYCCQIQLQKTFGEGLSTPWLDNKELQKQIKANKWMRWTGDKGTMEDQATWMRKQPKSLMSNKQHDKFPSSGKITGKQSFIYEELTTDAGRCGFKIKGTLQLLEQMV
jgi:hypothetical protein